MWIQATSDVPAPLQIRLIQQMLKKARPGTVVPSGRMTHLRIREEKNKDNHEVGPSARREGPEVDTLEPFMRPCPFVQDTRHSLLLPKSAPLPT
ncbi:unnamed protein product [Mycena citricolor]|uniref:Uncharacterized protein n=1 Tax=Mycena citricolor TaxID=2018698 RepID=A0AAD2HTV1_9AGAR|nr:unnamed protein product [Mycena citricolor]